MKKLIILFTLILFIISCGEKVREEITERHDNGSKKQLVRYKGQGSDEVVVESITYSESGETLILEKPLDRFKMVWGYYDNGKPKVETKYRNGKQEGLETWWYESGQKNVEKTYKDGKPDGKWSLYR